jgi:ssDNA-binding Zn-finger/Zn-ribbon topoisomerase 1
LVFENDDETKTETARVYCEKEHDGDLAFLPIKLLTKAPVCPKCEEILKFIATRKGTFLGCRNYPKCSHYVPVRYEGEYTMSETLFEGTAWNH